MAESATGKLESMDQGVGSVVSLWRYPVKSMQGEELNGATITERGILGDRTYALQDLETGHIASAKHPGKWAKLFECRAAFVELPRVDAPLPHVWITLPDGTIVRSDQPDVDPILSDMLGRGVTLLSEAPGAPTREADRTPTEDTASAPLIRQEPMALAAPAGTFFDYAVLHILTTATLKKLRTIAPNSQFETRRFRPNIVIDLPNSQADFIENDWPGRTMQIGDDVNLRLIAPCPRCIVTTLPQSDLPRDATILRTIAQNSSAISATIAPGVTFPAVAGVYADVRATGFLRRGDTLTLGTI